MFKFSIRLLNKIKEQLTSIAVTDFITLPVNTETIALDRAMNSGAWYELDYDIVDNIYIEKDQLILFMYENGTFGTWDEIIKINTPVIALDIDGVLADIKKEINRLHPEWDGKTYEVHGVDFDNFKYDTLESLDIPSFSVPYILTMRPEKYRHVSADWLDKHYPAWNMLIHTQNKLVTMTHYGIDVLVDDNPYTFEAVNAGGKVCYLYDATYNQHIETDLRIYKLSELKEKLNL